MTCSTARLLFPAETVFFPSDLKERANQRNAQKSTGPKTESGKARSALNAISHGLSGQPIFDTLTQEKIDNLAGEFAAGDVGNTRIMALAREAAEAQVMIGRVKEARRRAWEDAACDGSIKERGGLSALNNSDAAKEFYSDSGMPIDELKSIMPYMFVASFETDAERDAAILALASKKLFKLIRYERYAANRRDKAIRKLMQINIINS